MGTGYNVAAFPENRAGFSAFSQYAAGILLTVSLIDEADKAEVML